MPGVHDGRVEECPRLRSIGQEEDGVCATFIDLPANILHKVPDGLAWDDLAYVESVSQALAAACVPALGSARHIAVVGRGPVAELTARVIETERFGWRWDEDGHPRAPQTPPLNAQPLSGQPPNTSPATDRGDRLAGAEDGAAPATPQVYRLDPGLLDKHPRAFDVIVEAWADPGILAALFKALRPGGGLIHKTRPGRPVSLLRQTVPTHPVRVIDGPYGSFGAAMAWMTRHAGALQRLDREAHAVGTVDGAQGGQDVHRYALGFPFSKGGIQAALACGQRREKVGKLFLEIGPEA